MSTHSGRTRSGRATRFATAAAVVVLALTVTGTAAAFPTPPPDPGGQAGPADEQEDFGTQDLNDGYLEKSDLDHGDEIDGEHFNDTYLDGEDVYDGEVDGDDVDSAEADLLSTDALTR